VTTTLSTLDYLVILAYLVGTLAIGIWIGRRVHSGTDFFLAGRTLPWWAVGMSLVATDIGGTDIIGGGGAAYNYGLVVANFEWIGCVPAMIVAAFLFVPFLYRTGVYTVPEFMERRYNAGMRSALAVCWLVFMACNLGVMLLASAKMMHATFGWNEAACIWATALLVGFYTAFGGLAAVVYTDVIQCVVMIGGCLLVLVLGLIDVGGIDGLQERLAANDRAAAVQAAETPPPEAADHRTSLVVPVDAPSPYPWPAIYFGLALILSPAYWIGNQAIIQRSLGANSEFAAKASYVWGALLKNVIPLIIAVPGLIAAAKFPDLKEGDAAFPRLVSALLPSGLKGVFVAGFLAALMSSVDSYLNSAATILSHDLYKRFIQPQADERRLLVVGRVTTCGLLAWGIAFAFLFLKSSQDSGIYAIFQTLMSFFQGPALAVLLIGVFWRRATGTAAVTAFLCGIACTATLFTLNQEGVRARFGWKPLFQIPDPFLYFSVWAFLVTALVLVVVSCVTQAEPDAKTQYVLFNRRTA
jgi:SSS family solute:Na+ symporter